MSGHKFLEHAGFRLDPDKNRCRYRCSQGRIHDSGTIGCKMFLQKISAFTYHCQRKRKSLRILDLRRRNDIFAKLYYPRVIPENSNVHGLRAVI